MTIVLSERPMATNGGVQPIDDIHLTLRRDAPLGTSPTGAVSLRERVSTAHASTNGNDPLALERALVLAEHLVASARAQALQLATQFDLSDSIALPPVVVSVAAQAGLRVAAPLYLAAQLEFAQVLPAAEVLSGLGVSGGLGDEVHDVEPALHQFWEGRHSRFTQPEREALFMRWFGERFHTANAPTTDAASAALPPASSTLSATLAVALAEPSTSANMAFETLMVDTCEALFKFDPNSTPRAEYALAHRARALDYAAEQVVRLASRRLAVNLIERGGGLALFAAQELIDAIKQALALLKALSEHGMFGSHSIWELISIVAERYLNHSNAERNARIASIADTMDAMGARVTRAKAGEIVLAWLAQVYPDLVQDQVDPILVATHPVVRAAQAWLEATLRLRQAEPA